MLGAGGTSYAYDSFDQMTSFNAGAATFVHDGDGNRVAKTSGGVTTQYLVDDANPTGLAQVAEEVVNGAVTRRYVYGLGRISQTQASGTSYYGYDAHGDVRTLMNASSTVTDTYDYDAFGNLIASTGTTANVYRYQGEALDTETGLYYLRARHYDPTVGRFVSVDPLADQGEHPYTYSSANPVDGHDPTGLQDVFEYKALLIGPLMWPHFSLAMAAGGGHSGGNSGSGDASGPGGDTPPGCMGGGGGALNAMAILDQVGACSGPPDCGKCFIKQEYRTVKKTGGKNHNYIYVGNDSGSTWVLEGEPEHDMVLTSHGLDFGYLIGVVTPGSAGDPKHPGDNATSDHPQGTPLIGKEYCDKVNKAIAGTKDYVNAFFGGLPLHYHPAGGPNSNTFAHEIVGYIGVFFGNPPDSPGW